VIAQGLAAYLRLEPERWRRCLVQHADKKDLEVFRRFAARHPTADQWARCRQVRRALATESPDFTNLPDGRFSNSGSGGRGLRRHLECRRSSLLLLRSLTICGIPEVRLEGSVHDWLTLRRRAEHLAGFDLGRWLEHLLRRWTSS